MQRVDFTGLSKSCLAGMIEQMLLSLNNFASHGSGWTVHRIENVELRFVKSKPISASSYLALPTELDRSQYLLNIRNRHDEEMFPILLYSTIAQQNWTQIDTGQCLQTKNKSINVWSRKSQCNATSW